MLVTDSSLVRCGNLCCQISNRKNSKQSVIPPTFAKKKDYSQNSTSQKKKPISPLKLPSSRNLIIQSATGVLALGFIDAGYSGDWSRIGVISRGTEDLLKSAAFFVVPLCIFLIFFLFKNDGDDE